MKPYMTDLMALPKPPMLTREEFVARYMPEYAKGYSPDYRIRTYVDKHGRLRVPRVTASAVKGQNTKRKNRIDTAYGEYMALWREA